MTDPIDYSRPVGWWCPVCKNSFGPDKRVSVFAEGWPCRGKSIPVYLPIPEGQRPLIEDEADEAEVVTFTIPGTADPAWCAPTGWTTFHDTAEEIYEIVVGINRWKQKEQPNEQHDSETHHRPRRHLHSMARTGRGIRQGR